MGRKKKEELEEVVVDNTVKFTTKEIESIKQQLTMISMLSKEQLKTVIYNQLITMDENVTEEWIEENILN